MIKRSIVNRKGLTLVEIIISMAIIGIVAMVFLSVFSSSFVNIVRAGVRTKAVAAAANEFHGDPSVVRHETIEVELPLPSGSTTIIDINGSIARGNVVVNEGSISNLEVQIEAFVPGFFAHD